MTARDVKKLKAIYLIDEFHNDQRKEERVKYQEIVRRIEAQLRRCRFLRADHSPISVLMKMIVRCGRDVTLYTPGMIQTAIRWVDGDVLLELKRRISEKNRRAAWEYLVSRQEWREQFSWKVSELLVDETITNNM